MTRKTANAVKAAEADVQRWAKAKGEQAAKLAAAEGKREPLKAAWVELCLAADVDGADNASALAEAEAKMGRCDLAIERARLSLAECDKRWAAAKDALAEAEYNDAMAELERLDGLDEQMRRGYEALARDLKGQAGAMYAHAEAKRQQVLRAEAWANMAGLPNRAHPSPMPFEMDMPKLSDPLPGVNVLEMAIERRRGDRGE